MSHFSVIVLSEDGDYESLLAPYSEQDDEYSEFVSQQEEVEEDYKTHLFTRYKDRAGTVYTGEEDQFYRPATPEEAEECSKWSNSRPKHKTVSVDGVHKYFIHQVPDDCTEVKMLANEVFPTLAEFVEHYHGYAEEGGEFGYYSNPNAKWDWYSLGGRWQGSLRTKDGVEGEVGELGLFGKELKRGAVDMCKIKDLDMDAMLKAEKERIQKGYEELFKRAQKDNQDPWLHSEDGWGIWNQMIKDSKQANTNISELRKLLEGKGEYYVFVDEQAKLGNPDAVLIKDCRRMNIHWPFLDTGEDCETAMNTAVPLSAFAVLHEHKGWSESGEMGFFGVSLDSKDPNQWQRELDTLVRNTDPEWYICVIDCHI